MTLLSKSMRLAIALIMSIAFVQATSAQADPRYQYLQRSNGAPASKGTSSTNNNDDDDDHDDDEPKNPTQTIPFDGGLSLFVLAGAGIAAKKRFDKRKAKA